MHSILAAGVLDKSPVRQDDILNIILEPLRQTTRSQKNDNMSPTDRIAVIGHNGWAAQSIIRALASQLSTQPVRVLAREGSSTDALPANTEVARYSWKDEKSIGNALEGVDVLLYFTS